jgi:hypothetical protein
MLCEKCKKLSFNDSPSACAQGIVMSLGGKKPRHEFEGRWFPGGSRKDLEDWCAKNCIVKSVAPPVKGNMPQVKEVKEVKEEVKSTENKDKKKD